MIIKHCHLLSKPTPLQIGLVKKKSNLINFNRHDKDVTFQDYIQSFSHALVSNEIDLWHIADYPWISLSSFSGSSSKRSMINKRVKTIPVCAVSNSISRMLGITQSVIKSNHKHKFCNRGLVICRWHKLCYYMLWIYIYIYIYIYINIWCTPGLFFILWSVI